MNICANCVHHRTAKGEHLCAAKELAKAVNPITGRSEYVYQPFGPMLPYHRVFVSHAMMPCFLLNPTGECPDFCERQDPKQDQKGGA